MLLVVAVFLTITVVVCIGVGIILLLCLLFHSCGFFCLYYLSLNLFDPLSLCFRLLFLSLFFFWSCNRSLNGCLFNGSLCFCFCRLFCRIVLRLAAALALLLRLFCAFHLLHLFCLLFFFRRRSFFLDFLFNWSCFILLWTASLLRRSFRCILSRLYCICIKNSIDKRHFLHLLESLHAKFTCNGTEFFQFLLLKLVNVIHK